MFLMDLLDHCLISAGTVTAYAVNPPDNGGEGTGWSVMTGIQPSEGTGFSDISSKISSTGNSLVYIMMMIIGFVGVIGLGIAGIKIMVGGAATKSEAKGSLFWILVAAVIGFGAIAIIGLMQTIGSGLNTATENP